VAATLKEAVWPVVTVWLAGCVVIEGATGAALTVSVAGAAGHTSGGVADHYGELRPVVRAGGGRCRVAGRSRPADDHTVSTPLIAERAVPVAATLKEAV